MTAGHRLTWVSCALAALLAAGCSAASVSSYRPTEDTCYDLAVQVLQRHVTLTAVPPACAGLSPAQVNMAVARAIREVTGPWPKAVARHLAYQDRAYLARLVSTVAPPAAPPPAAAPPLVVPTAGHARPSRDLPLDLAALAAWVFTAGAGTYLLAGWLVTWLARLRWRSRRRRAADATTAFTVSHFGLAVAGLGTWIGFVATGLAGLAWVALGMVVVIAGLGMAVLAAALPGGTRVGTATPTRVPPAVPGGTRVGTPAGRGRLPVIVIAAHGMLATVTILLVLLAAIGAG